MNTGIPLTNQWVELEAPAWKIGMVNRVVQGLAFSMYNGQAVWDQAGIKYSPASTDTDADGLPDEWETLYFGDLSQRTNGDYDSDGLSNRLEVLHNSNPDNMNSDSEGYDDSIEVNSHQTDPGLPDSDFDGYNDGEEVDQFTDPLDPNSHP